MWCIPCWKNVLHHPMTLSGLAIPQKMFQGSRKVGLPLAAMEAAAAVMEVARVSEATVAAAVAASSADLQITGRGSAPRVEVAASGNVPIDLS